jgi:flavodoxin I
MNKIGIIFGTDSGTTRLIAKKMAKILGDLADKPININRIGIDDLMKYDVMIIGTPTYGVEQLPGISTGIANGSWEDFLPQLEGADLSGKVIALYGLGNQDKYSDRFVDSMFYLYDALKQRGASFIGEWDTEGYTFDASRAVVDGKFLGLVLDNNNQAILTDQRIDTWLKQIKPMLVEELESVAVSV